VRWLSFDELDQCSAHFDRLVAETPETDRPCASTDWILPAQNAFAPAATPRVLATDDGYVALMSLPLEAGARATLPLEAVWQLASPFVGAEPERLVEPLYAARDTLLGSRQLLVLCGLAVDGRVMRSVHAQFSPAHRVHVGPTIGRCVASLDGGMSGFLSRRSAKFRASVLRARRAAVRSGVSVEYHAELDTEDAVGAAFERVRSVEQRSWKGRSGTGMNQEPSWTFYNRMARRLARRRALRLLFLRRGGDDVAYVFGGLFAGAYRGQQASFDHDFARESLGCVAHLSMIEKLCDEGVQAYDLGSDLPYKRRWGEKGLDTATVYVVAR
jgi:CelD/BcsL family acetyltransferase involved in cellulose biosynthesis